MEPTTDPRPHVPPADDAWNEPENIARPRPMQARFSSPADDLLNPGEDEANSDLGNSGRDVIERAA